MTMLMYYQKIQTYDVSRTRRTYQFLVVERLNNPNVANAGGLQSPGVKGEVVVFYFEPLTTQNLKSSGVPEG